MWCFQSVMLVRCVCSHILCRYWSRTRGMQEHPILWCAQWRWILHPSLKGKSRAKDVGEGSCEGSYLGSDTFGADRGLGICPLGCECSGLCVFPSVTCVVWLVLYVMLSPSIYLPSCGLSTLLGTLVGVHWVSQALLLRPRACHVFLILRLEL